MAQVKAFFDSVDPRAWYLFLSLAIGTLVFAWRKLSPATFEKLPAQLQALPALLLGAVAAASTGGGAHEAFVSGVFGALSGLAAVGGHHAIKAAMPPKEPPSE